MSNWPNVDTLFRRIDSRSKGCRTEIVGGDLIVYARNTNRAYVFDWSADAEKIFSHWAWHESKDGYLSRICRNGKRRARVMAHRLIMGVPPFPDAQVDHIDRNPANNLTRNLHWVTNAVNSRNRKMNSNNTSGFKGVSWSRRMRKWRAIAEFNSKQVYLGKFANKIDAALCYDAFAEDHGLSTNKELNAYRWEDFLNE
jgi:hypothetical protein